MLTCHRNFRGIPFQDCPPMECFTRRCGVMTASLQEFVQIICLIHYAYTHDSCFFYFVVSVECILTQGCNDISGRNRILMLLGPSEGVVWSQSRPSDPVSCSTNFQIQPTHLTLVSGYIRRGINHPGHIASYFLQRPASMHVGSRDTPSKF